MNDFKYYTYLIGWLSQNKFYYGVRYANIKKPIDDLWKEYFTSSKEVHDFRLINGEPDIIQIRKVFNDIKKAISWENKVLQRLKVVNNDKWLNKSVFPNFGITSKNSHMRGRKHSPETIEKMRISKLGKNNPFYGKKHSDTQKQKWKDEKTGISIPEERKHKISQSKKNVIFSEEHKKILENLAKMLS